MSEQRAGLGLGVTLIAAMALGVGVLGSADDRPPVATPQVSSTTTTTVPVAIRGSGPIPISDESLERVDLALFGDADPERPDREVVLVTFDGTEMGRGPLDGWSTNNPEFGVDFDFHGTNGRIVLVGASGIDDPVAGCPAVHGAGGVRAVVCGPEGDTDEIRLIGSDGNVRVLSGPVADVGHWRFAIPSPNGRWVLAQWSAECEVPVAYLIRVRDGRRRPVVTDGTFSHAIGWTPDGRAIVGLPEEPCGVGIDSPGTYLVEPDSFERHRLHAYAHGARFTGNARWVGNRLEAVMARAHDDLGLEYCCNQPSHGGGDAEDGFVFEGHQVEVHAVPHDELRFSSEPQPGMLQFDCGTARYFLRDHGPEGTLEDPPPNPRFLERAALRLIPGLYCTSGPNAFSP